ncbi:MAG: sigma 54-interacting transcriptional regulator, partial [Planctomycetes bacterium]|nr:sigma 54-interacting transcriptional regulator [Planctomycetota bacterium]
MRQTVLDVFESHPRHRELSQTIRVIQAERVTIDDLKGSIIVARGLTYRRIRSQFPNLPCVEVVVHTADILAALRRCGRTYQPKRIALVGHFPYLPPTEAFEPLLGCRVVYYPEDSVRTMRQQIARALEEGADALAGGYSLCLWAESNGQPATIVTSSRDAIRAALDEALRTYDILQQNEIAKIALENTREAVLYADHAGLVSYCNPAARHLLEGLGLPSAQDIPLGQALPFLVPVLDGSDGRPPSFDDALFDFRGTSLAASATPVFIGDAPAGAVVTVTTVESIRRLEYTIRRRLSEKGLRARYTFDDIICGTEMAEVVAKAKKCALVSSNILIVGETGTGKELFAQSIHNHSGRKHGPFVAINCAALPEHLIESELFGYSEGAFTGARRGGKLGLIETAHGGTLFLDEVSELPLAVQGKLLRVLQEREVRRLADDKLITVDVLLIAASHIPL